MQIGIDESEVNYIREKSKSIGNSITLPSNVSNKDALKRILLALTEQVTYRLRRENLYAKVVSVQLRTSEFKDFSHQLKLEFATSSTKEIYEKVKTVFDEMYKFEIPIRLVGVRVDNLVEEVGQISMFDVSDKKNNIDNTLDELKNKYGYSSIMRAGEIGVEDLINIEKFKK